MTGETRSDGWWATPPAPAEYQRIDPRDYRLIASWKANGDDTYADIARILDVTEDEVRDAVREGAKQRSFND